jgi:hypothetical protein
MLRLPEVRAGSASWRLPVSDGEAAQLVAALLAPDTAACREILLPLFRVGPTLVLWASCRAESWCKSSPRGVAELVDWFSDRVVSELQWGSDELSTAPAAHQTSLWSELTYRSLVVAARSARLIKRSSSAGGLGNDASGRAYLLGLLHTATEWLSSCGPVVDARTSRAADVPYPRWLGRLLKGVRRGRSNSRVAAGVAQIARQYRRSDERKRRDRTPDESTAAARWSAGSEGESRIAESLPNLAARLLRLAKL